MKTSTTLGILREVYGTKRRKGLNKLAYQHPSDVLDHVYFDLIDDMRRSAGLFRLCLLHDVIEDSDLTAEELQSALDLDNDQVECLKLLSRNVENADGSSYLDGIMANEDALIVKLADRVANLDDLMLWVKKSEGFEEEALAIAHKYLEECEYLVEQVELRYGALLDDREHFISRQIHDLNRALEKLEDLMEEYLGGSSSPTAPGLCKTIP